MPPGVLDSVGGTPLVRVRGRPGGGGLHARLELLNPFGMKDRVAKHILLEARRRRQLAGAAAGSARPPCSTGWSATAGWGSRARTCSAPGPCATSRAAWPARASAG
jgi:hypothetical protein